MPRDFRADVVGLSKRGQGPRSRRERILEEEVFEVRKQQLLVLLFVIEPQFEEVGAAILDERHCRDDRRVDMAPIACNFGQGRTGKHSPPVSRMARFLFARVFRVEELVVGKRR